MDMLKVTHENVLEEIEKRIKGGLHGILYMTVDEPMVFVHKERQVDTETCDSKGYDVYEAYYNGGTILGNKGDFAFAHFENPNNNWLDGFIKHFLDWLKAKGINAVYEDNDVLVDGYKVCGVCATRYGRIDYSAGFIGIYTNIDHIKAICRKPMKKIPKGLSEYGITTEEVEQMFLEFCEQHK